MGATEIRAGQLGINYIVDGSHTESLGMFELTVPPGSNVPPPHSHANNEECAYVLAGTLRYSVGAETRDLTEGQTMSTPRGEVHAFSNPFAETARALIVLSPDIGLQRRRRRDQRRGTSGQGCLGICHVQVRLVPGAPK